jgi:NAD(P)-dependent dehydrogenase (short-subunit alcohol dehydrogenase family)
LAPDGVRSSIALAQRAQGVLRVGGSITFTSGISRDRSMVPGAAGAGAFDYMVRALARAVAPTRVNVMSPGWGGTPM